MSTFLCRRDFNRLEHCLTVFVLVFPAVVLQQTTMTVKQKKLKKILERETNTERSTKSTKVRGNGGTTRRRAAQSRDRIWKERGNISRGKTLWMGARGWSFKEPH